MSYPSKSGRLGPGISSGSGYLSSKWTSGIPTGGVENLNLNAMKYTKGSGGAKQVERPSQSFQNPDVSKKDFPDSKCCDCCVIQ